MLDCMVCGEWLTESTRNPRSPPLLVYVYLLTPPDRCRPSARHCWPLKYMLVSLFSPGPCCPCPNIYSRSRAAAGSCRFMNVTTLRFCWLSSFLNRKTNKRTMDFCLFGMIPTPTLLLIWVSSVYWISVNIFLTSWPIYEAYCSLSGLV